MANKKKEIIKNEEDVKFAWMSEQLVECQKLELVHQRILTPLQKEELLDMDSRKVKEFLYVLSQRGFLGMSQIVNTMRPLRERFQFIDRLYPHVEGLYQAFNQDFEDHSKQLYEE